MDVDADQTTTRSFGLTRVESDAHEHAFLSGPDARGKATLDLEGRRGGRTRLGEETEELVAARIDLLPARSRDCLALQSAHLR